MVLLTLFQKHNKHTNTYDSHIPFIYVHNLIKFIFINSKLYLILMNVMNLGITVSIFSIFLYSVIFLIKILRQTILYCVVLNVLN